MSRMIKVTEILQIKSDGGYTKEKIICARKNWELYWKRFSSSEVLTIFICF